MTRRLIGFLVPLALAMLVAPLAPAAPWDRAPTLTVAAPAQDRRIPLALAILVIIFVTYLVVKPPLSTREPLAINGYGQEADCPAPCRCKTARDRFRSCSFSA
jgi:hypothetical protein